MTRFWGIAILIFAATTAGFIHAGGEKDFAVKGKLTKDDPKDAQRNGPSQVHAVKLKAGKTYTIDMVSTAFDSYLRLMDAKGNQLEQDDDSGGDLNARIIFNCPTDGEYRIVCTTFGASPGGDYALTVKTAGGSNKPGTAHASLLGKDAPDFQADFAVNGKPASLADLKGKIVLLNFYDIRSSACTAYLTKLGEWNKAYKADGLAVVGLTFYPTDIGQKFELNKKTGAVATIEKADRKSDQALLGAFAAHHKVEHLLMAARIQNALNTFDAYVVNGLPQTVLIDRKGVIRYIDVGGEKNSKVVESEIKKVLAEK